MPWESVYSGVPHSWEAPSYTRNTFFIKSGNIKVQKGVSEKFNRCQFRTLSISSVTGDFGSVNIKVVLRRPDLQGTACSRCLFGYPWISNLLLEHKTNNKQHVFLLLIVLY